MDIDTSYDQEDDSFDSDAIDSEIEERLYAQIYHQSDGGNVVTSFKQSDGLIGLIHETDPQDSGIESQKNKNSTLINGLFSADEIITIGSDSEDDLCSKSMIVGKITKPADDEISDSESSFLDICSYSSDEPSPAITSRNSSNYSLSKSDNSISQNPSNYSLSKSDTSISQNPSRFPLSKLANVTGSNVGLSRVSLTEEMKDNFIESSSSEKGYQSSGDDVRSSDDDVQILDDDEESGDRVIKRLSSNNVLKTFLGKCRPAYCPSMEDRTKRKVRSIGVKEEKKFGKIKEVTIELLNSIPGSNNRFKRMRLDPGESADLWKVDIEDMACRGMKGRNKARYYRKHRCNHCRDFTTHTTERCPFPKPEPVCSVCGNEGHVEDFCDNIICSKCFRSGHDFYNCSFNFKNVSCNLCSLFGHEGKNCSNHWRQHHLTTTENKCQSLKIRKNVSRICCGGCGRRGHFAHECHQLYANKSFWPTSPFLEPSSAMFNINNKIRSSVSRNPATPKKDREKSKKSDPTSNSETASTPATLKTKRSSKSPKTPAAIDSLSTLFDPSMSNANPSNGKKTKRNSKKWLMTVKSSATSTKKRKRSKASKAESTSVPSDRNKNSKPSKAGPTSASSGKKRRSKVSRTESKPSRTESKPSRTESTSVSSGKKKRKLKT